MIVVFKTDVREKMRANYLVQKLNTHLPCCRINFDLSDCDKVLRIEGECLGVESIKALLVQEGCQCEELV